MCGGDQKLSPFRVERRGWLRGDDLVQRPSLLLEGSYVPAKGSQHVAELSDIESAANRSVSRDEDGLAGERCEIGLGRRIQHRRHDCAPGNPDRFQLPHESPFLTTL